MPVEIAANQRHAVVGKTGSGKTFFSVVLAAKLIPPDAEHWQCWWIDTKLDPRDGKMLKEWGFGDKEYAPARKHLKIDPKNGPIDWQVQQVCMRAMERRNVLVVLDEYKHAVQSNRRAGPGIEAIHLRGRGLNVGMIGQTQQPVEIPRELLSQATNVYLFDLSYPLDQKNARTLNPAYQRPRDAHGFWHAHIDGRAEWRYFPHVKAWHDSIENTERISA